MALSLILTRSQGVYAEIFTGLPLGSWDRFVSDAVASPQFTVIYRNEDSEIMVLSDRVARTGLP